ncbi:MAG: DoxX family protein [Thermoleophilia bacterium]
MATMRPDAREHRAFVALACLRVLMGAIFLAVWGDNLAKGLYSGSGWHGFVGHYADTTKVGAYGAFLRDVMLPHASLIAPGQLVVELLVGVCLVVGLFTPVAGLLGGLFQLNLLIATSGTTDWPGTYIALAAICLVVAVSQSGRTLGLDALLARRRRPPVPVY